MSRWLKNVTKLYIDFSNFDKKTDAQLRESIRLAVPFDGCFWSEWKGKLRGQETPHISLVYAQDLTWREAVRISNLAVGQWVVLVGARVPDIGLPVVKTLFKWAELYQFTGVEKLAQETGQPHSYMPRFALTMPGITDSVGRAPELLAC